MEKVAGNRPNQFLRVNFHSSIVVTTQVNDVPYFIALTQIQESDIRSGNY